jgi:hypothetical protein
MLSQRARKCWHNNDYTIAELKHGNFNRNAIERIYEYDRKVFSKSYPTRWCNVDLTDGNLFRKTGQNI